MKCCILNNCVILGLVLMAGCSYDSYLVEMEPEGDAFQRTVSAWKTESKDGSISQVSMEKLRHFQEIYPVRTTPPNVVKQTFKGRFTDGRTPPDLGGDGSYTRFSCPLGTTAVYLETFEGNNSPFEAIAPRLRKVDRYVEVLGDWLETEFGKEKEFPALRKAINTHLRTDLKNLLFISWFELSTGDDDSGLIARLGHYLSTRGYFTIRELPGILRALDEKDWAPLENVIQRRTGLPRGGRLLPRIGQWVSKNNGQTMKDSLSRFMAGTPEYRKLLKDWEKEKAAKPDLKKPAPLDAYEDLFTDAMPWSFQANPPDHLEVRLKLPVKPHETNGTWDSVQGRVAWTHRIRQGNQLPSFCYAFWAVPNGAVQKKLFGRTILEGEALADYVFTYRKLEGEERRAWDEFINGLEPATAGDALKAFSVKAKAGAKGKKAAASMEVLRRALVNGLGLADTVK